MTWIDWFLVAVFGADLVLTLPVLVLGEARHRGGDWLDDLGWVGLDVLLSICVIALVLRDINAALLLFVVISLLTRRKKQAAFRRVFASVFADNHISGPKKDKVS